MNVTPLVNDLPEQFRSMAVLPRDQMKLNVYIGLNFALGRSRLNFKKEHTGGVVPVQEPAMEGNPE